MYCTCTVFTECIYKHHNEFWVLSQLFWSHHLVYMLATIIAMKHALDSTLVSQHIRYQRPHLCLRPPRESCNVAFMEFSEVSWQSNHWIEGLDSPLCLHVTRSNNWCFSRIPRHKHRLILEFRWNLMKVWTFWSVYHVSSLYMESWLGVVRESSSLYLLLVLKPSNKHNLSHNGMDVSLILGSFFTHSLFLNNFDYVWYFGGSFTTHHHWSSLIMHNPSRSNQL